MRTLYVDASVFITLSAIDHHRLLATLDGSVVVPRTVAEEIVEDPAASHLEEGAGEWLSVPSTRIREAEPTTYRHATIHLGRESAATDNDGDVTLLAYGLETDECVIITDDKPLRETCKALGIDVSGSIGVLVVAVERGTLSKEAASDALLAMDEVGARLSARLLRRAERLIEDAAEES